MPDHYNDDWRRGYNDALRFYDQHEAEREKILAELRQWKAEQLLVESSWDVQAVGKALGIKWGEPIRQNILAGIEALKARLPKEDQ